MIRAPHSVGVLATVGPRLETEAHFTAAIRAGARNFRFHCGHRDRDHVADLKCLRDAARELACPVTALFDLPSSRPRLAPGTARPVLLGDRLRLVGVADRPGDVAVNGLLELHSQLRAGDLLSVDDGAAIFTVVSVAQAVEIEVTTLAGGSVALGPRMSVTPLTGDVHFELVLPEDFELLARAIAADAVPDWIALSFVSSASQLARATDALRAILGGRGVRLMAKIETSAGVRTVNELAGIADGVMVARGDLLAAVGPEHLSAAQDAIMAAAHAAGKPAVIATQFLESFCRTGVPSRPEIGDIARAVDQAPVALMLGRETCASERSIESIQLMNRLIAARARTTLRPQRHDGARPLVVAIEGPNGVGKSTLLATLSRQLGLPVLPGVAVAFLEPGLKRRMILEADWRASALYFLAGAIELSRELAIGAGTGVVLLDRSIWSTVAVHAATDPLRKPWVMNLLDQCRGSLRFPDHLLVLEANYSTCLSRIAQKHSKEAELDRDDEQYHAREQAFYRELVTSTSSGTVIATDDLSADAIAERAKQEIRRILGEARA